MQDYYGKNYRRKVLSNFKDRIIPTIVIAIVIWLLSSLTAKAQEKIEGIGIFKINQSTIKIIDQVSDEMNAKVKVVDDLGELQGLMSGRLIELKQNIKHPLKTPSHAPTCFASRAFLIKDYKIAKIRIKNIYLVFVNDTLASFTSDSNEDIQQAMRGKYGKGVKSVETTRSTCGQDNDLHIEKWKNGDIEASVMLSSGFDYNCRRSIFSLFLVYSQDLMNLISDCSQASKPLVKDKVKKSLKDF